MPHKVSTIYDDNKINVLYIYGPDLFQLDVTGTVIFKISLLESFLFFIVDVESN